MKRRAFNRQLFGLAGGLLLPKSLYLVQPMRPQATMRVNGERLNEHLTKLSTFGANPDGGVSRVAFGDADLAGRAYVTDLMRAAGLQPRIDFAGNLIGSRKGSIVGLKPLMLGSHIDSVPNGGNYDGPVGALAAIEVAQTLNENQRSTRHPLEIVVFCNEEGGKTGSRLLSGEVMDKEYDLVTRSGKTIRDGVRDIGGDPERFSEVRRQRGEVAAYLELHIEQGAVLESEQTAIGVVEGIVGIKRWNVTIEGFANHAGTTPMNRRRDALLAAAQFTLNVNRIARETPGKQVATVGRIQASPGAPNVIPGRVELSLEIRDLDMAKIDRLYTQIVAAAEDVARTTGTTFQYDHFYTSQAALTDDHIRAIISEAAADLNLSTMSMPSGAGHDAQSIAQFAPIGMIFIPSVAGISHSPNEFSRPQDIANGADVLLNTTVRLDSELS